MSPTPALPGPLDPAVVRRAAEWMARLWSGEASDQDRAACEHWRAQHPDHERAWNRLQSFEDKLHALPREAARHALREPVRTGRRRALQLLGLTAAVGGIAAALRGTETWQLAASDHSTRTGEIREIALPDGTRVVLGTATAIDLRFDAHERRLVLRAGEILVTTAPDPAGAHRPFRVHSRQGSVEALGTRFSVRQEAEASRVAVFEGAVAVRPARAPEAMVRVGAGQGTVFFADRAQAPDAVADSAAAWTRGVLVAEDMRVADFVAELARYRPGVLRCDPEVAELRVTGVFSLRDTDRALENLALALPVSAAYRTRYWVTVRAR
ncbi:FecR domain-containing protein [Variovorax paradoxus]|uniref:FecR domain-containing protein n=1 Tax=Variovorax paradoxus TaxID=34073 RepID=UPI001932B40B|nr:FecR domain-containing protein [Variovorax paradoxus]